MLYSILLQNNIFLVIDLDWYTSFFLPFLIFFFLYYFFCQSEFIVMFLCGNDMLTQDSAGRLQIPIILFLGTNVF